VFGLPVFSLVQYSVSSPDNRVTWRNNVNHIPCGETSFGAIKLKKKGKAAGWLCVGFDMLSECMTISVRRELMELNLMTSIWKIEVSSQKFMTVNLNFVGFVGHSNSKRRFISQTYLILEPYIL
jgi:hypothetical protein